MLKNKTTPIQFQNIKNSYEKQAEIYIPNVFTKIFFNTKNEPYTQRLALYKKINSTEDLFLRYVNIEPHAFQHIGSISNLICSYKLNGSKAISIGMDFLKDSILVKNNKISIDCFDIDNEVVTVANEVALKLNIDNLLKYKFENILESSIVDKNKYDLAILCQMDYIFDDFDINKLASIFFDANIKHLIILTPSAFQISKSPMKLLETMINFICSLRSLIGSSKNSHKTYRRNIRYLIKILLPFYKVANQTDYRYPSGRIFQLYLQKS
jgi:hypothetical protein